MQEENEVARTASQTELRDKTENRAKNADLGGKPACIQVVVITVRNAVLGLRDAEIQHQ